MLFSLHDVPTRVAASADEALAAVRAGGVGVVVQDMNFAPGETSGDEGAALFHAIRAIDPAMPVLLMTAFTSLERAVSLVKAGATDYFGKPWDDARLVASVRDTAGRAARCAARRCRRRRPVDERDALAAARPARPGLSRARAMARVVDLARAGGRGRRAGAHHRPERRRQGEDRRDHPGQLAARRDGRS